MAKKQPRKSDARPAHPERVIADLEELAKSLDLLVTRRFDAVAARLKESQILSPKEKGLLLEEQEELSYLLSHGP